MTELMIFIWVIGVLFSIGLALGNPENPDNMSNKDFGKIIFISIFFWPVTVGVALSE